MKVDVHEAGQHIHARDVDLVRGRAGLIFDGQLGPAFVLDGYARHSDPRDGGDAVAFDHDVHRADGRSTRPVDHDPAAEDQPIVGSQAFIGAAVRGRRDLVLLLGEHVRGQSQPPAEHQRQG